MTQQQIPGTERDEIPKLQKAAEKYRKLVQERMAIQRNESEAKANLTAMIHLLIDEGEIDVPDTMLPQMHTIYRYEDDDGQVRDIKFSIKESVKVNLAKEDEGA